MNVEKFQEMCEAHDITFDYSDDIKYYQRGQKQLADIKLARKKLGDEICVPIWNAMVNKKLRFQEDRERYYWRMNSE